jgi:hypothetical protein
MSIEEALLEIEARQFIGRRDELARIERLLERARTEASVAYVYGQRGIGKTALLRAAQRSTERRGIETVAVTVERDAAADEVIGRIASAMHVVRTTTSQDDVLAAISVLGTKGLLLILDDYDLLGPAEAALRTRFLYRLPPGVAAVLSGRMQPATLWPLERTWRSFVERLPLSELSLVDAERFLQLHGVEDPVVQREANGLTGGRPALLAQVADVLGSEAEVAAARDIGILSLRPSGGTQTLILEQLLHPGSRRAAWRAEDATAAHDLVLQAASLLPYFSRNLLAAMLGDETVAAGWEVLERLPSSLEPGGWHRLGESLRRPVAAIVARERPWLRQVWLRRAIRRLLVDDERVGQKEHALALWLLLELDDPSAGNVRSAPVVGSAAFHEALELFGLPWLTTANADGVEGVLMVPADDGSALGAALLAPAALVPGDAPPGPLPQGSMFLAIAAKDRVAIGPLLGLLAAAMEARQGVAVLGDGVAAPVLERLGLKPVSENLFLLAAGEGGARASLQRLADQRLSAVPVADRAALAKEALQAYAAGGCLGDTGLGGVYRAQAGQGGEPELRRWLLDALASAQLGEMPCSRSQLLRLYYVDKAGSHEDIAERLDLPRASYFRAYREALAAFGGALCGAY